MKRLPEIANAKVPGLPGLKSKQIKRVGNIVMYLRDDNIYEVGEVQLRKAEIVHGKEYPEREVYWYSEQCGFKFLATNHKDKAELFFKGFLENIKVPLIPYPDKWN